MRRLESVAPGSSERAPVEPGLPPPNLAPLPNKPPDDPQATAGRRTRAQNVTSVGFGVAAIRPRVAAVDASTPTITRADVEQYVASVKLGTVVDFQCGPVSVIQGVLPTTAPRLVDVPPLICMAGVRGTFRVHQPGGPMVSGSMLYAISMPRQETLWPK